MSAQSTRGVRFQSEVRALARPEKKRTAGSGDARLLLQPVVRHHGDEFDLDEVANPEGHLCVAPVRDYVDKVPQHWDVDEPGRSKEPANPHNQTGPLVEDAIPVVTTNDFWSYLAAFDKRSNSQPPSSDDISPEQLKEALSLVASVDTSTCNWPLWEEIETERSRWMAKFSPDKQDRMSKALNSLLDVKDYRSLGWKTLSVKRESLLKRYDPKWAPRLIYAGTDEFNTLTGPAIMVLMERIVELFSKEKIGPLKIKLAYKCDDVALADFICDPAYPHIAEGDFSANDLRQRRSVAVIFDAWLAKFAMPQWLRKLFLGCIDFQVSNNTFGHTASLSNQLPTGTTITTPRNSLYNGTMEACYAIRTGNTGKCIILGDDFLGALKKKVDKGDWEHYISLFGMKLTAATPDNWAASTIISRRICEYTDSRPCMMPKLGKALARFNVRVSQQPGVSDSAYMAGKALSYAYEFRHFPIFRDMFLNRFKSEPDRAHVSVDEVSWFTRTSGVDLDKLSAAILSEPILISDDNTREMLMDAYGYTFGLEDAREFACRIIEHTDLSIVPMPSELRIDVD
jgi:hypothetical protein